MDKISISSLPVELLIPIFSYLPYPYDISASQTCKLWNSIILTTPSLIAARYHPLEAGCDGDDDFGIPGVHKLFSYGGDFCFRFNRSPKESYSLDIRNETGNTILSTVYIGDSKILDEPVFSPYITPFTPDPEGPYSRKELFSLRLRFGGQSWDRSFELIGNAFLMNNMIKVDSLDYKATDERKYTIRDIVNVFVEEAKCRDLPPCEKKVLEGEERQMVDWIWFESAWYRSVGVRDAKGRRKMRYMIGGNLVRGVKAN